MGKVWEIFTEKLAVTSEKYHIRPVSFVLMSNHFHFLVETPEANLGRAMNYLLREVSRSIGRQAGRINHVFGGPYNGCLIQDSHYLRHAYKYVYRNPVAAGIESEVESYPFSTLRTVLGKSTLPFTLHDEIAIRCSTIPAHLERRLEWLNREYSITASILLRRALRRRVFALSSDNNFRRACEELNS